jgi:uncharacterized protein YciI
LTAKKRKDEAPMQFLIYAVDKQNNLALRMETRPAHLKYLEDFSKEIVLAGPLLTDDGQTMIGSLFIVEMPTRKEAEAFSVNDPYRKAGVFGSVTITAWRKALPK